jgi:hypothetical protein
MLSGVASPWARKAYGLVLHLPFECSWLPKAAAGARPDVVVDFGPVPGRLDQSFGGTDEWEFAPGRTLFRGGEHSGTFLLDSGTHVTVERGVYSDDDWLAAHFTDRVLIALLRQRRTIALHAGSVAGTRGAIAVSGFTGSGKSTTIAALVARGFRLLDDDVAALELREDGTVQVLPGSPRVCLTAQSVERLGIGPSNVPKPVGPAGKIFVPAAVPTRASRLRAFFILAPFGGRNVEIRQLRGIEKLDALYRSVLGHILRQEHADLFPTLSAVAAEIAVHRIDRPLDRWSVDELVDAILRVSGETPPGPP